MTIFRITIRILFNSVKYTICLPKCTLSVERAVGKFNPAVEAKIADLLSCQMYRIFDIEHSFLTLTADIHCENMQSKERFTEEVSKKIRVILCTWNQQIQVPGRKENPLYNFLPFHFFSIHPIFIPFLDIFSLSFSIISSAFCFLRRRTVWCVLDRRTRHQIHAQNRKWEIQVNRPTFMCMRPHVSEKKKNFR